MHPRLWLLVGFILLASGLTGCGPDGIPITEYQQGYRAGVGAIREIRATGGLEGFALAGGAALAVALDQVPTEKHKSADWNAGFRKGFKDEFAK